jgi:crotonobetainyl-CoA:carnitine CoA-transferase CaiB-like acyl-CoA transferase
VGIPIGDLLAGYFAAIGILVALLEREQSGRGQRVETSLLEALTGSLSFQAARYVNTGEVPPPVGNHHPLTAPMGVYAVRDGYVNLAVGNDEMWRRFCEVLGRSDLAEDPRFDRMSRRVQHRAELDALLDPLLRGRTATEWVDRLNRAGVACGPIYTLDQVFADPQVRLAELVRETVNEAWGPHKVLALPVQLSRTPARVERGAPRTGEHTCQVLTDLGYDAATIEAWLAEGVVEQSGGEQ